MITFLLQAIHIKVAIVSETIQIRKTTVNAIVQVRIVLNISPAD